MTGGSNGFEIDGDRDGDGDGSAGGVGVDVCVDWVGEEGTREAGIGLELVCAPEVWIVMQLGNKQAINNKQKIKKILIYHQN
jgi:hypothetical protein